MSGTDPTITGCVKEITPRLFDAAAAVCLESAAAVRIWMKLDELLHEASTPHGTIMLLHHLPRPASQKRSAPPG
jgi:hypothetical protein